MKKRFANKPHHIAVLDPRTKKILRWERLPEASPPTSIAINPVALDVIDAVPRANPNRSNNKRRKTKMAGTVTVKKGVNQFKKTIPQAVGIVVGTATSRMLTPHLAKPIKDPNLSRHARYLIPMVLGTVLGMMVKNPHAVNVGVGMFSEGVATGLSTLLPPGTPLVNQLSGASAVVRPARFRFADITGADIFPDGPPPIPAARRLPPARNGNPPRPVPPRPAARRVIQVASVD